MRRRGALGVGAHFPSSMLVPGIAWCSYVVLFLIVYPFLRGYTGIVAFLPVLMTGWYAGAGPGVLAGLAAIPVTLVLTWFGSGSSLALSQETVIGATMLNAMGGWLAIYGR